MVFALHDPERWRLPYRPEAMIIVASNLLMSLGNPETVARAFSPIPFIVSINTHTNETTDALADLVLPDLCYLEKLDIMHVRFLNSRLPPGRSEWALLIRQPVAPPPGEARDLNQVFLELAERLGILPELHTVLNSWLRLKPPYTLNPEGKYSLEDIFDAYYRCHFGPERGLEWFKQNGGIRWPRRIEEAYWRPFVRVRTPIYLEHVLRAGREVARVAAELGIDWDVSDYQPLPDWKPCPSHETTGDGLDFFAFYYKVPGHTFSWTVQNAWLNELGEVDPWTYGVLLNRDTARRRGIKDGDLIWVESSSGFRIKGRAVLSAAVHPEALGIAANCGHWSPGMPLARGKGALTCELHPVSPQYMDFVSGNLDLCVKARVTRA